MLWPHPLAGTPRRVPKVLSIHLDLGLVRENRIVPSHHLPGSSVHGTVGASIFEWVAVSYSRESLLPRDQTSISCISGEFTTVPPGKPILGILSYNSPLRK